MNSDPFKKSLVEIFNKLDPELVKKLSQNENLSEARLAGKMLWRLIAEGAENDELCSWAAEAQVELVMVIPEEDSPLQQEIRKSLAEGLSIEETAEKFAENSKRVWPAYTKALALAVAKSMQSDDQP